MADGKLSDDDAFYHHPLIDDDRLLWGARVDQCTHKTFNNNLKELGVVE
jgi:hypothetical protein